MKKYILLIAFFAWSCAHAGVKSWDDKYPIDSIEVTVVYFVPADRTPLPDWRERVDFYCKRIEAFHHREFDEQSVLTTKVRPEPFRSQRTTDQLRPGDANQIYFKTLGEVDKALKFGTGKREAYPILLVLSDVNWRPLDDFFRVRPEGTEWLFEGNYNRGRHFPGARAGGARALYIPNRGVGWGLVSADGWRVPYSGSDTVVYHEGVGHAVGMPHPEPGDDSVMSKGQYRGWLSESWVKKEQKEKMGWVKPEKTIDRSKDLFSSFRALPDPLVPKPGQPVSLVFDWPELADVDTCRVRLQTDLFGPWVEVPDAPTGSSPDRVALGAFDRPTPVSYRVDVQLKNDESVELWGYFQVRECASMYPKPPHAHPEAASSAPWLEGPETDLLELVDVKRDRVLGGWVKQDGTLESPKGYGMRIELPYEPKGDYRLTVVAEPLDEPNGLILGQRMGGRRFQALFQFGKGDRSANALEDIDGKNVGKNATTTTYPLFEKNRLSQIVCTVRNNRIEVRVDGRVVMDWEGKPEQLSLSDYWKTPNPKLFLGAYDCRYRFHRVTVVSR